MMLQPIKSDVRVALCETHPALRSGFQTALYRRGMRDMEVCKDSAALLSLMQDHIVDLVVCSTDLPGLDFCDLMQQIRHGTIGRNPFTLVLATVGEATIDDIRRIVNAGVDRVVRKPMSMGDMVSCVNALAASRKPFVATESYVGPSRRAMGRSDRDCGEVMEVPNTLSAKLGGDIADAHLESLIERGMSNLYQLRTHNSCLAISRSILRISQHFQRNGQGRIAHELSRLMSMCEAIDRRYRGTDSDHLAEVAYSLGLLVDLLITQPANSGRAHKVTIELMQKLGDVIRLIDENNPAAAATVQSIAQTVRLFASTHLPSLDMAEPSSHGLSNYR